MTTFTFAREILSGKDLYRILMNKEGEKHTLRGFVVDIGGGAGTPSYHRFFKKGVGAKVVSLDLKTGIDFEQDPLPCAGGSADVILAFNVLEHVYRYEHLISEIRRVLKPGALLLGAVPFLLGYHPDPHDYWRFTSESVERMLRSAGFKNIELSVLGTGPCSAAFSQIEFLIPRVFKLFFAPFALCADWLPRVCIPRLPERFPLGYFFKATA